MCVCVSSRVSSLVSRKTVLYSQNLIKWVHFALSSCSDYITWSLACWFFSLVFLLFHSMLRLIVFCVRVWKTTLRYYYAHSSDVNKRETEKYCLSSSNFGILGHFWIHSDPRWKFASFFSFSGDFLRFARTPLILLVFFGTESTLQEIVSRYCADVYRKKVNKRLLLCCLPI